MSRKIVLLLLVVATLVLAGCPQPAPTEAPKPKVEEIKILWAEWDPADYLQQIGNLYEEETGVKVNIVQEPWGSFYDRAFTEFAAGGDAFDGIVGDSQWLGQGATQGHYVDMTDFLVGEGIADTVTEATLTYYGEYPTGSGRYWAFPTEGDADGWAYRKDLFEDSDEKAAFKAEYGYDLDVPETYDQLLDIAKFFTRPNDGLYGVAIYTQKEYDAITMGVENTFFTYGARWQDPETNEVIGWVNSDRAVEALEMYRELYQCCQAPGLSNAFFADTNDAFISGQSVMAMNYFAFFPALASPEINPYADGTGFFVNPAGPYGDQAAALGGQGLSIVAYISPERQEAMKDFIRWFAKEDIQAKWGEFGGYTCNRNVLKSDEFLNATPFNPAFAETMGFVMDFWNIPVYAQLLEGTQRELHKYIVAGEGTAKEALDLLAEEHDKILRDTGFITVAPKPKVEAIKILWAEWDPADYLQQIGNLYEEETGVKVNIVQEPWGSFYDRAFTEFAAGGDAFDGIVGDSQWLGQGATQGHYVDMTDFLVGEGIADTVTEATLTYYGEYPTGSGRYWAFPTEGDADGWAYRKDLFEDSDEKAAFKAEYGYDLDVPETYDQLLDIAKFFTRPNDGLYGVAIYTQKEYDAITMGVENTFFTYGARWQDPETNEVIGWVNSDRAVEALEMYRELYQCCQAPGLSNAFFADTNDAFISGQSVMAMNYFAFFPALASPEINPYADGTGFFVNPAGPYGDQAAALGGQGLSIVAYISPERQEAMKDFIRWFAKEDIQAKWGEFGGYTCNRNVLKSDEFLNATPFNPAFAETMGFVMDFWNIPVYAQLLEGTQRELHKYIVAGEGTAKEALDLLAEEHDKILRETGFIPKPE